MLTQEQALEKAIAHFKVDAAAITNLQIYQENDDGIQVYDIEFVYDGKEYSAEVDVTSGAITSSDIDTIHQTVYNENFYLLIFEVKSKIQRESISIFKGLIFFRFEYV